MAQELIKIQEPNDLKVFVHKNYMNQITNFFGDQTRAMKFLSSMMADVQRNPVLMECTPMSVVNSYMTMAQLGFMPSSVSGEAYVIPYNNSKKKGNEWVSVKEAQFQMGYQGLVTLFYQAGVDKINAEIVRANDKVSIVNNEMKHEVDPFKSIVDRGEPVGAYVIVTFKGEDSLKYMNGKDIIAHAQKFSKSYDPKGKHSPWNPANDPELWMWKKTVLKQHAKLLPKNEIINKAIEADNRDSIIADRLDEAKKSANQLKMGSALDDKTTNENKQNSDKKKKEEDDIQITMDPTDNYEDQGENFGL
jgi:phage RecT family recombinase